MRSPAPPYQPDHGRTGITSDRREGTSMTTVIQPETVAERAREILAV
ncbi:hypothetical protein [Streptomyces virginiae]|uniref:Uncharacterized protein n=1 Tax=Streptomyces virginiae TaxID=1961 RepID=A0ABZ1TPF8_STRVG|nr:hypothetical protein [Streptomyces virginiae]